MMWLKSILLIIVIPLCIFLCFLTADVYKTDSRIAKQIKKIKKNNGLKTPTFRRPIPPPERKPMPILCDKCIHKRVCRFYFNTPFEELKNIDFCCYYYQVDNPDDYVNKKVGAESG